MKISNRLAQLIRKGEPAVGMWVNTCDPAVAEIAGLAGYDWIMIDTEHNPFTEAQVQGLLYAAATGDMQTIVRVCANREEHVKWVLDSGAGGIIIPGTRDADDARHSVRIAKYHPLGSRGYGPHRASGFWTRGEEYTAGSNDDILLICQIELASAVDEIDEICRIEGIDGIWIGPTDLAQSLGHLADAQHDEVQAAIAQIIETATRHEMPWGIPAGTPDALEGHVEKGGTIMVCGSDTGMLRGTAQGYVRETHGIFERLSPR